MLKIKSKKKLTIKACEELVKKYRNPDGKVFFYTATCPLCPIHYNPRTCEGCPLASKDGCIGCTEFDSYQQALKSQKGTTAVTGHVYIAFLDEASMKDIKEAFENRAKFFEKIIPILKKVDKKRFTRDGWKYFDELDRRW